MKYEWLKVISIVFFVLAIVAISAFIANAVIESDMPNWLKYLILK